MKWCEACEEWVEPEYDKCPNCGRILERREKKPRDFDDDDIEQDDIDWIN